MPNKLRNHRLSIVLFLLVIIGAGITLPSFAQTTDGAPTGTSSTENFFEAFFVSRITHANGEKTVDFVGTTLLWILLLLSVVNLGLIGVMATTNQRKHIVPEAVVVEVKRLLGAGDYKQAMELTKREESFFSQIVHAGLNESTHGYSAMMRGMEQKSDLLVTRRMRPIELLYMFGQISPMMGLLGTVYGIIFAFKVFVSMGGKASPALLAGGIGTALVATFWGLVVAIPALAGYSILRNKVDQLTLEAAVAAEELLSQFKPRSNTASATIASASSAKPAPSPKVAAPSVNG